ncbi:TetR/AcrR family transcriptional regulator, partial [Arthrobacter sp. AL08]|nr:TetR/AcrR family transcriptional regulator [Arthrobacter sp. AL08]
EPADLEARVARTVRFIQLGAGARFDVDGAPLRASLPLT